jgi:hypothetical protein
MGNSLCRVILGKQVPDEAVEALALLLRATLTRPSTLHLRDLAGRRVRNPGLLAARDAGLRLVDLDPGWPKGKLLPALGTALGADRFVLRVVDDEDRDVIEPHKDRLAELYPGLDLEWALEPEEQPVPWNRRAFFVCPHNPPQWGTHVPVMATLLSVATPGQSRPCPACRTVYTSRGERGQCPACGFVAYPFKAREEMTRQLPVPLDAFGWGRCPRCRKPSEFIFRVQQCFTCGQLLTASPGRHPLELRDNADEIKALVGTIGRRAEPPSVA